MVKQTHKFFPFPFLFEFVHNENGVRYLAHKFHA